MLKGNRNTQEGKVRSVAKMKFTYVSHLCSDSKCHQQFRTSSPPSFACHATAPIPGASYRSVPIGQGEGSVSNLGFNSADADASLPMKTAAAAAAVAVEEDCSGLSDASNDLKENIWIAHGEDNAKESLSSPASSTTSKETRKRKKVRFPPKEGLVATQFVDPRTELTFEEKRRCWYQSKDMANIIKKLERNVERMELMETIQDSKTKEHS